MKKMGMTITQKILAAHAGLDYVVAGQLIEADLDMVLANDITGPVAIHEVEKLNKKYLSLFVVFAIIYRSISKKQIGGIYFGRQQQHYYDRCHDRHLLLPADPS